MVYLGIEVCESMMWLLMLFYTMQSFVVALFDYCLDGHVWGCNMRGNWNGATKRLWKCFGRPCCSIMRVGYTFIDYNYNDHD